MNGIHAPARVFGIICVLCVACASVMAQGLPGRIAFANSSPTPVGIALSRNHTSDVFYGSKTTGPYPLSWKPITKFSELVTIDGQTALPGLDYNLDYVAGVLTFTKPIDSARLISVDYGCDFATAVQNKPAGVPMSFGFLGNGNASMSLTALSSQAAAGNMDFAATYSPIKQLNVTSSMKRTQSGTSGKGEVNTAFEQKLAFLTGGSKITLGLMQAGDNKYGLGNQTTTTNVLQLDQSFGKRLSAVASHQSVSTGGVGAGTNQTTDSFSFAAKPLDNLSMTASFVGKNSSGVGSEHTMNLNLDAAPTKGLNIKAGMLSDSTKTGRNESETFALSESPNKNFKLDMNVVRKDSDTAGSELSHSLKLVASPSDWFKFDYGLTGQNAKTSAEQQALNISMTPISHTVVQLNWKDNNSSGTAAQESSGIHVETTPISAVKLTGLLAQDDTSGTRETKKQAGIDVVPFKGTKIDGAYSESEKEGLGVTRVTEVSASTAPLSFLSLSGGYKTRQMPSNVEVDSSIVSVKLSPVKNFTLTGAVATNPDDSSGNVQYLNSQSVGLQTNMGKISLKGALSFKNQYQTSTRSQSAEVGADFKLSPSTLLSTTYSQEQTLDPLQAIQTETYALTFTQKAGANLDFFLTGRAKLCEKDQEINWAQADYQAEARLGLRF